MLDFFSMTGPRRRIGILTGGGDAPGLNAVIRAAVKSAILKYKWKVIGIPDGFDGLIWPEKAFELTLKHVSGILPRGGTILGTTNRGNPFQYKTTENGKEVIRDISPDILANAAKLGIDAVITIGGDGSQTIALELFQKGMKIVGVPKTIDNDLSATEVTFGFDTALTTATDAVAPSTNPPRRRTSVVIPASLTHRERRLRPGAVDQRPPPPCAASSKPGRRNSMACGNSTLIC